MSPMGKHAACGCPAYLCYTRGLVTTTLEAARNAHHTYSLWMNCFPAAFIGKAHSKLRSELRSGTKLSPVSVVTLTGKIRSDVDVKSSLNSRPTIESNPVPYVTIVLTPGWANSPRSGSAAKNLFTIQFHEEMTIATNGTNCLTYLSASI